MGSVNELTQILSRHTDEASDVLQSSGSKLLKKAFKKAWDRIGKNSLHGSGEKRFIEYDTTEIQAVVSKWTSELEAFLAQAKSKMKDASYEELTDFFGLESDVKLVLTNYEWLKKELSKIDLEFENAVLVYRSPLQQALTDITLLFNEAKHIRGDFAGVKNVSVYVHGIESNGDQFLKSVKEVAKNGEIIVHITRKGKWEYFYIEDGEPIAIDDNQVNGYMNHEKRLHLIYDTEKMNEHRQKTSDDLAKKLTDLGLINKESKIDIFGHSYGGRRSFQFAIDYPDSVRSITTIGAPYDSNFPGTAVNKGPEAKVVISVLNNLGFHPWEYSSYVDSIDGRSRTDSGVIHSNVYTDLEKVNLVEDIETLKVVNPEVYNKIKKMNITAAAGREERVVYLPDYKTQTIHKVTQKDSTDGVVHVESQNAKSLKGLVDNRPIYHVDGNGWFDPAHVYEIESPEFKKLIQKVNTNQEEVR